MDKEKAKALSKTLACYKELQENNSVNLIEFHTADGQKHGIGNPEAVAFGGRHRTGTPAPDRTVR
jgi:hypothetical protein